jgi:hypothetical protein
MVLHLFGSLCAVLNSLSQTETGQFFSLCGTALPVL